MGCKAVIEHYADNEHKRCKLLKRKWQILREIVYILQIPLRATVAVQRHDLTLSDAFGIWTKMQIHLVACARKSSYKTSLAKHLLEAVIQRKEVIYSNPFMTCAIFLDPRYRNQITSNGTKVEECKRTLVDLWNRSNHGIERDGTQNHSGSSDISFDFDVDTAFESYLRGNQSVDVLIDQNSRTHVDIELILDCFQPEIIPANNSILEFWENAKITHPELYKLAMQVYCVPPSQVYVEQDFSHLNHVFNNKRSRLQSARLNDIMILHLNKEVFQKIKSEELRDAIAQHQNQQETLDQESCS